MTQIRLECPVCEALFDAEFHAERATSDSPSQSSCPDCGHVVLHSSENMALAAQRADQPPIEPPGQLPSPQIVSSRRQNGPSDPYVHAPDHPAANIPPSPTPTPQQTGTTSPTYPQSADPQPGHRATKIARPARAVPAEASSHARLLGVSAEEDAFDSPAMLSVSANEPHSAEQLGGRVSKRPPSASELARKKSGSRLLILVMMTMFAIGAATAAVYVISTTLTPDAELAEDTSADAIEDESDGLDDVSPAEVNETVVTTVPISPELQADLTLKTAPYLVRISSGFDLETKVGAGILIDTRGWIATPLSLVAGANFVEVGLPGRGRAAAASETTVRASGVMAYSGESDLAIIRISTEFIAANVDITPSIDDYPVAGAELALLTSRIPNGELTVTGCRVEGEFQPGDHLSDEADPIAATDASSSSAPPANAMAPLIELSVAVSPQELGSPLMRLDGALAGMAVEAPAESDKGYAVSVASIQALRSLVSTRVKEFDSRELTDALARYYRNVGWLDRVAADESMNHGGELAPPGTLASREQLQSLANFCAEIDWFPTNMFEQEKFQDLALYLTAAEQIAVDDEAEEGIRLILGEASEAIRAQLSQSAWPDEEKLVAANQLAINSFDSPHLGVYCYAKVEHPPGIVNHDDNPTVVMKLIGSDHRIVLPCTLAFEELTIGSEWLIVGKRGRNLAIEDFNGERSMAPIVYSIYLIERPERIAANEAQSLAQPSADL